MLTIDTQLFGTLHYQPDAVIDFPDGLYAFEDQLHFLLIEQEPSAPLLFLQSVRDPALSFMTMPAQAIDPSYGLSLAEEDIVALGFPPGFRPAIGRDIVCLVLVTAGPNEHATCNLLAPIVINHAGRRGRQVIQFDSGYSHQHALPVMEAECF